MDPGFSMFDPQHAYDMEDDSPTEEDIEDSEDDISEALESIREEEHEDSDRECEKWGRYSR